MGRRECCLSYSDKSFNNDGDKANFKFTRRRIS